MAVFFDLDLRLSPFTTHGLSRSKTHISASDPFFNVSLFFYNILAGFIVNVSIIFVSGSDSL